MRLPESVVCPFLLGLSELLGNILKHADPLPGFIGVRVDLLGSQLRLEVTDDGGSFFFIFWSESPAQVLPEIWSYQKQAGGLV